MLLAGLREKCVDQMQKQSLQKYINDLPIRQGILDCLRASVHPVMSAITGHCKIRLSEKTKRSIACQMLYYLYLKNERAPDIPYICSVFKIDYTDLKKIMNESTSPLVASGIECEMSYNRELIQRTIELCAAYLSVDESQFTMINGYWDMLETLEADITSITHKSVASSPIYPMVGALVYYVDAYKRMSRSDAAMILHISYSTMCVYIRMIERIIS